MSVSGRGSAEHVLSGMQDMGSLKTYAKWFPHHRPSAVQGKAAGH